MAGLSIADASMTAPKITSNVSNPFQEITKGIYSKKESRFRTDRRAARTIRSQHMTTQAFNEMPSIKPEEFLNGGKGESEAQIAIKQTRLKTAGFELHGGTPNGSSIKPLVRNFKFSSGANRTTGTNMFQISNENGSQNRRGNRPLIKNQDNQDLADLIKSKDPNFQEADRYNLNSKHLEDKMRNLKKMYNLTTVHDHTIQIPRNKSGTRNFKNRTSHDQNAVAQSDNLSIKGNRNINSQNPQKIGSSKNQDGSIHYVTRSMRMGKKSNDDPMIQGMIPGKDSNLSQSHVKNSPAHSIFTNKKFIHPPKIMHLTTTNQNSKVIQFKQNNHLNPLQDKQLKIHSQGRDMSDIGSHFVSDGIMSEKHQGGMNMLMNQGTFPTKNLKLDPLEKKQKKALNSETANDDLIENVSQILAENQSQDNVNWNQNEIRQPNQFESKRPTDQQTKHRQAKSQNQKFMPYANNQKTSKTKFENLNQRFNEDTQEILGMSNNQVTRKTEDSIIRSINDPILLAQSKINGNISKFSANENSKINASQISNKIKLSPYSQILIPNGGSQQNFQILPTNYAQTSQALAKRHLQQRQQRIISLQTNQQQTNSTSNNVQKAYRSQFPPPPTQPTETTAKKPAKSTIQKKEKKDEIVKNVIDKINLKIDCLNHNLQNYEQNIDYTLKEIPKDIRSMNTSNFNKSSSRQQNLETDRLSKLLASNGGMVHHNDLVNQQDTLSEQTLKTILDFHSDRAQTQHLGNRQLQTNADFQLQNVIDSNNQINNDQLYKIQLKTSRQTKSRYDAMTGLMDLNQIEEAEMIRSKQIKTTQEDLQNYTVNDDIKSPAVLASMNMEMIRKTFTKMEIGDYQAELTNGQKQQTERLHNTSFTNLQQYFQQRGINNNTNFSGISSDKKQIQEQQQQTNIVLNAEESNGSQTNQHVAQFQPTNFYPTQSRLSQKSAIVGLAAASHLSMQQMNKQRVEFE